MRVQRALTSFCAALFGSSGQISLAVLPALIAAFSPARARGVNATYVSRILRLTLLAPDIVKAILDGRQVAALQLDDLLVGFPLEWERQRVGILKSDTEVA